MDAQKDEEIQRLRRIVEAYEKLTLYGRDELIKASETIAAQERVQELSREELIRLRRKLRDLELHGPRRREKIKQVLAEDNVNEELILDQLEELRKQSDSAFAVDLFRVLTHHEFENDQAQYHWEQILANKTAMSDQLGREVSFRTALMDYFTQQNRLLQNPMVIEISIFDELVKSSLTDELTQLFNRRYYEISITREVNRARRHNHPLSLLILDIDDFKIYNDSHGHSAGDVVMYELASILRSTLRSEDIPCRFGGEEFVVILPETTGSQAHATAGRFLGELAQARFEGRRVSVSGGVAEFPIHADNPGALLIAADRALYRAKLAGKDRIYGAETPSTS